MAVAAFVCGVLPFFPIPLIGIILGVIARGQIRRSGGREKGAGLAMAGIVIGVIWTLLGILGIILIATHHVHCVNGTCTSVSG